MWGRTGHYYHLKNLPIRYLLTIKWKNSKITGWRNVANITFHRQWKVISCVMGKTVSGTSNMCAKQKPTIGLKKIIPTAFVFLEFLRIKKSGFISLCLWIYREMYGVTRSLLVWPTNFHSFWKFLIWFY